MKYFLLAYVMTVFLLLSSCNGSSRDSGQNESVEGEEMVADRGEIILSRSQFETMGMVIGNPSPTKFSNSINANGYIVATPSGRAMVSTLISGKVIQIYHSPGDFIRKDEVLFTIEGNEIIELQQEYAEAFHQLKVLKADYDRLKMLSEENVVAQKEFIKADGAYRSMLSSVNGLKARLKMIHIDPSSVENGELLPVLAISSPIQGTIIRQQMVLGQFIEPRETLVEIVDPEMMQLSLQVFEKDMAEIAIGQQVIFYRPENPERKFEATLSQTGKSIDPDSRVVQCLASIATIDQDAFLHNLFVETRIITCEREAPAIPEQALIKEEERNYVLVLQSKNEDQMIFKKIPLHVGVSREGYTEVLDDEIQNILIEGAYNLLGVE